MREQDRLTIRYMKSVREVTDHMQRIKGYLVKSLEELRRIDGGNENHG